MEATEYMSEEMNGIKSNAIKAKENPYVTRLVYSAICLKEYEYLATYDTVLDVDKNWTVALQTAINDASVNGNTLFMPNGTYKYSNLTIPNMMNIVGEHRYKTILKTTGTSGNAISIQGTVGVARSNNRISLSNFTLTTYGATEAVDIGITIDSNGGVLYPGYLNMENVEVQGLQKSTAIGLYLNDISHFSARNCVFATASGIGCKIEGTHFNTGVVDFSTCFFGSVYNDIGLHIAQGAALDSFNFNGCYFGGKTASLRLGNSNNVPRSINFNACHFENNTSQAGNCLIEFMGGSGTGVQGVHFTSCSYGGFGNCENVFKFNHGCYYGIVIDGMDIVNMKSTGYVINLEVTSVFKDCFVRSVRTATTQPTMFSAASFSNSATASIFGGWTIVNDGYTDFQRGLKIGGARLDASPTMPTSGSYTAGEYVMCIAAPVETGSVGSKKFLRGWKRITTGSAHVANTDWFLDYGLTGN